MFNFHDTKENDGFAYNKHNKTSKTFTSQIHITFPTSSAKFPTKIDCAKHNLAT